MEDPPANAINPRRWLVLTVVVAAQFMYVVDIFIVNVAIPAIRTDLHASTAQIESVIALYQIAYASMVITGGRLGDMYGARRLFLIGLIGFTATSLACGLVPSGSALVLGRLAQGFTAALMVPQVLPPSTLCSPMRRAAGPSRSLASRSGWAAWWASSSAAGL
jgi:MFS family permease